MRQSNINGKDSFIFFAPSNTFSKTKKKNETDEKPKILKARRDSNEVNPTQKMKAKGISGQAKIHYMRNQAFKGRRSCLEICVKFMNHTR